MRAVGPARDRSSTATCGPNDLVTCSISTALDMGRAVVFLPPISVWGCSPPARGGINCPDTTSPPHHPTTRMEPVVVATWPFGRTAVEVAAKLLAAGKPPLDAALAGAQAVEDDP